MFFTSLNQTSQGRTSVSQQFQQIYGPQAISTKPALTSRSQSAGFVSRMMDASQIYLVLRQWSYCRGTSGDHFHERKSISFNTVGGFSSGSPTWCRRVHRLSKDQKSFTLFKWEATTRQRSVGTKTADLIWFVSFETLQSSVCKTEKEVHADVSDFTQIHSPKCFVSAHI